MGTTILYAQWIGGGGSAVVTFDANGDGISDGIAWLLGAGTCGTLFIRLTAEPVESP